MSAIVQARLTMLVLSSAYKDNGEGMYALVDDISMNETPWFWPFPNFDIGCDNKSYQGYNPNAAKDTNTPLQPTNPPFAWTDVTDTTEDGRRIIIGRIPLWTEFWEGRPPESLREEIPHSEVDAYLEMLTNGLKVGPGVLFGLSAKLEPSRLPSRLFNIKSVLKQSPWEISDRPRGEKDPRNPIDPRNPSGDRVTIGGRPNNCWERICCLGIDLEKRELTAIVEITQSTGYGGSLCNSIGFESVGFWLIEPSRAELTPNEWPDSPLGNPNSTEPGDYCGGSVRFIGSKRIVVSDIPRSDIGMVSCADRAFDYVAGSLRYSVSITLSDADLELIKPCESSTYRLPLLHSVVAWNQDVQNENFAGNRVRFGDSASVVVQYPVTPANVPTRELAVGAYQAECPNVRYSNLFRVLERTGQSVSYLDTLAVSATPLILSLLERFGVMQIVGLDAAVLPQLARTCQIAKNMAPMRSPMYTSQSIPPSKVIKPFNLKRGNWVLCAVFNNNLNAVEWNPARDLILVGNGPGDLITCIGNVDSLQNTSLKIASVKVHIGDKLGQLTYREGSSEYTNYPPCIQNHDGDITRVGYSVNAQFSVYYPVRASDSELPVHLYTPPVGARLFILVPANGTILDNNLEIGRYYYRLIQQVCMQGGIVVTLDWKNQTSSFFLVDYLPNVLPEVEKLFSLPSTTPIFLFGHSMGGGQVAQLLTNEDLPDSDPRQVVRSRVCGGVLLAPTFKGDQLHMNVAPSLVIYGALDSEGQPFKLQCVNESGKNTGEVSEFMMSPIRLYENALTEMRALLFIDGATHFRWIQLKEDFGSVANYTMKTEQDLVLDGEFERDWPDLYYYNHDLILRSYVSYFFRLWALNEPNFSQCFFNPFFQIPELSGNEEDNDVLMQLHRYADSSSTKWINRLGTASSNYRYLDSYVKRTVTVDQSPRTSDNGGLLASTTLKAANNVLRGPYPLFDQEILVTIGRDIEFRFDIERRLRVTSKDVFYSQISILDPNGNLSNANVSLVVNFLLDDGTETSFIVNDEIIARRDVILTPYVGGIGATITTLGDMHTIEEVHVPAAWLIAECYGTTIIDRSFNLSTIIISCKADQPIKLGLGKVGFIKLPDTST